MIQTILSAISGGRRATCTNCDDAIGSESWETERDGARHCSVWCALRSQQTGDSQ